MNQQKTSFSPALIRAAADLTQGTALSHQPINDNAAQEQRFVGRER